jgi:ATP-dependent Lhr-like helicase
MDDGTHGDVLERFSPPVREWFRTTFATPTDAQARGWPAIAARQHTLLLAPTGSGKTLTAFLSAIDRLVSEPVPPKHERLRVIYLSPLRALAVDVDRNLRAPLEGIRLAAERAGTSVHRPEVGVRTGDTPPRDRERMKRNPPDVLITTPESLYLLLTSQARETLRHVETIIVDEIHAVAATKRGSHLAVTLERLEQEVTHGGLEEGEPPRPAPQRVALSATQRPLEELARFLGGFEPTADGPPRPRPVTIVDAGSRKTLDLEVIVPVEDLAELGTTAPSDAGGGLLEASLSGPAAAGPARRSIWPAMHPRLLDLVLENRSTLIFVNARRLAERLAAKLNELHAERLRESELRAQGLAGAELEAALAEAAADASLRGGGHDGPELVMAHHGSLSRERRLLIEDRLKSGQLRGLVATSSLELGIDMGAVDLVVQVSSPGAVSRGLQRIGRAGHQVGAPSRGVLFPKYRGDLVETAVVVRRMRDGLIESTRYPRNPLDVLAQQIVAAVAVEEWPVDALLALVRRAAPFAELSEEVFHAVLDLLDGRYPSEEFSELRARVVWDRVGGTVRARGGAQRLAVTNPGTIPDRGLFGVFLPDGARVGELDEEMVHESRPGETFVLGASTWRIEDITYDRVVVTPAPGQPGKLPFWHGDGPGRPFELGAAIGTFLREVREAAAEDRPAEVARLRDRHDLDAWAADNLVAYLEEQLEATGVLPDDRTVVVERFRDELGDWRICILSPFGAQIHAPWAMALERQLTDAGLDPEVMWADDGIVLRVQEAWDVYDAPGPETDPATGPAAPAIVDQLLLDPDEVEQLVVDQLAGTALFTTTFREAAGRALLLPKRRPGKRTALWQQRQRAADLLEVASRYPSFPMLLEATREVLQDVFDLPALRDLLGDLQARRVRVVTVDTPSASPFAQSLLFGWVGQYMYEYDAPLAERRAAALALDADLLRELLGGDELRELLDADVLDAVERELQRLAPPPELAAPRGGGETEDEAAARHAASDRRARDVDELHDVLRAVGDLTLDELATRATADPGPWVTRLLAERRAIEVRVGGEPRIAAAEDAARLRDAIGVALPPGLPQVFTDPVDDPLADLVGRYARTHGPFSVHACAARLHVPPERIEATLRHLERQARVLPGEFRPGGSGREWVDAEVLRRAKRRSLAALRREVEPVEAAALGRFLPAWHGVRGAAGVGPRRGLDALVDVVAQLQGAPIPASVLETDVLPSRIEGYRPGDLDELIAAGEVVWLGVEPIGSRDGRVVLCFRDQVPLLAPLLGTDDEVNGDAAASEREVHAALLSHLTERGASFWPDLQVAAGGVADPQLALDALWDLVWGGAVTNDTYQPVRDLVGGGRGRRATSRSGRPRHGRLARTGVPSARGRWSLTRDLYRADASGDDTVRAHALAEQLLARHGVLTREAMRVEAVRGGYATIYPVLKALEEAGRIRRGYAVAGLGAAQFAAPGAIDRLRGLRAPAGEADTSVAAETLILAATDPAQPYGAALPWPDSPGRPARSAGAFVVLVDGHPTVLVERNGRSLTTFAAASEVAAWAPALRGLVDRRRLRKLEIVKVDGVPVHDTGWAQRLADEGFTPGYRGLLYRGGSPNAPAHR